MPAWTGANRRILEQLAENSRKSAMSTRSGYITDIKTAENGEQKARICWGKTPDGKECKSPWLSTTGPRGEGRERPALKKGQNMRMQAPNGDFSQALLTQGPEGDSTPAPDHAQDAGEKSVTNQNGKSRSTLGQTSSTMWIAEEDKKPPEHKPQPTEATQQGGSGGGSGGASGSSGSGSQEESKPKKSDPGKPSSVSRLTGDQVMGRHKDGARYAAHKEGAKLKMKKDEYVFVKEGEIHVETKKPTVSKPWVIKKRPDPIPDDDDLKDKDEGGQGGGQGGGSGGGSGAQA